MLGSNCTARLYYMPQGEVFQLNKVRLASLPEGKKCSSWQELLEKVHPDLELVVNGETELIVRKNEIAVRISLFQLFRQAVDF